MDRYLDRLHSPMMRFFDIIYKLVYLNALFLLGTIAGLGVFGVYPSLLSLFRMTRYVFIDHDDSIPYWKRFMTEYKKIFFRANILFVLVATVIAITVLDAIFLYQNYLLVDELTVLGVILSLGGLLLIFIVTGVVFSIGVAYAYFENFTNKQLIQFSLFTTFSHPILIALYVFVLAISYLVFSVLISASFFLAASLPVWIMVRLYKPHFFKLFILSDFERYTFMNIRYIREESQVYDLIESVRPTHQEIIEGVIDGCKLDEMDSKASIAVLSKQEELIGILLTKSTETLISIQLIAIKPEYQKDGIASQMLTDIRNKHQQQVECDLNYLVEQVPYTNVTALRSWLQKNGFKQTSSDTYTTS